MSQRAVGAPSGSAWTTGAVPEIVSGVRLADGSIADLRLSGGRIDAVGPSVGATNPGAPQRGGGIDATGWRFVPAASEPHAHLDKALTAPRIADGAGNDLISAIESWRAIQTGLTGEDIHERALLAVERYAARGITTIRSHVDAGPEGDWLRGVDALLRLREELAGRIRIQVCLLAGQLTPDDVIAEAIARGIDVVGGCPHLTDDPVAETTRMLDHAERSGLPVDLHTDEQTDADEVDIVELAKQVIARGMAGRVTASHCVRLGSLAPDRLDPVLELVAEAGIGIVTLPITNLALQGWEADHLMPRGITAVRRILDAGIPLAAGGDNLRDPFNPAGRADPFETTSLLMTAGHLTADEALSAVTTGARTVLGLAPVGAVAGADADFLLVPDVAMGDVLAGATDARIVFHAGRIIADTRIERRLDLASDLLAPKG